jgi:hypothetical protein
VSDNYFGVCPTCGKNDGYVNVGRGHWFVCDEHKFKWFVGSNLFDSWKEQTEEEQRQLYEARGIGLYKIIALKDTQPKIIQKTCRDLLNTCLRQVIYLAAGGGTPWTAEFQGAVDEFSEKIEATIASTPPIAEALNEPADDLGFLQMELKRSHTQQEPMPF